jgi:tetratricopeptide (TPR) repeat protein
MLPLIIPPIIVIAALVLLVYFFSQRFLEVEKAMEQGVLSPEKLEARNGKWLERMRHILLSLLEKMAQRFKVGTLKAYNFFHEWTQALREKKRERTVRGAVVPEAGSVQADADASADEPDRSLVRQGYAEEAVADSFVRRPRRAVSAKRTDMVREEVAEEGVPEEAPRPRRARASRVGRSPEERAVRPMVSREMTRPEKPASPAAIARPAEKNQLEEILIERIAANPRDIEAYERLGDYYLEQENPQDAKECYRQVLRLSPVHRLAKIKIRKLERMLEKRRNF